MLPLIVLASVLTVQDNISPFEPFASPSPSQWSLITTCYPKVSGPVYFNHDGNITGTLLDSDGCGHPVTLYRYLMNGNTRYRAEIEYSGESSTCHLISQSESFDLVMSKQGKDYVGGPIDGGEQNGHWSISNDKFQEPSLTIVNKQCSQ